MDAVVDSRSAVGKFPGRDKNLEECLEEQGNQHKGGWGGLFSICAF